MNKCKSKILLITTVKYKACFQAYNWISMPQFIGAK